MLLRAGRRDAADCAAVALEADGEGVEAVDVVEAADMLGVSVEDIEGNECAVTL